MNKLSNSAHIVGESNACVRAQRGLGYFFSAVGVNSSRSITGFFLDSGGLPGLFSTTVTSVVLCFSILAACRVRKTNISV